MALFRHVGNPVTIAPGATHFWEYWFGVGLDVGVALVTPNLLDPQINVELVASDNGVLAVQSAGEGGPLTRYTVRVHNRGTVAMTYDLNVGNLL